MVPQRFAHLIHEILLSRAFAVVGVSRDPEKFGHQVYQTLKRAGYVVYAVNPNIAEIDGEVVYPHLDNLPERVDCVVAVVPPEITFEIVRQAGHLRIPYLWMQPGAESEEAILEAEAVGIQAVYGGPCIMVEIAARTAL